MKRIIYNEEDYAQFFKDKCFVCGCSIPKDWEWYKKYGNSCDVCCARAGLVANHKINRQEADRLVLERRLKYGQV